MKILKQKTVLTVLVLLSCTLQPCSGFILESMARVASDHIAPFIWGFIKLIIEGPTGLVIRALTYDYFGIGDAMWDGGWWIAGQGVKKISTVGNALLWSATVKAADTFWDVCKWVLSGAWNGVKYTANFVKGAVGISTALEKLDKLKTKKIAEKSDTATSTAKPDGVNVTVVIGRHNADFTGEVSPTELNALKATLEEAFLTASHYDQHLCLPLVLCTIFADDPSFRTAHENELALSFRLLQDLNPPPSWAKHHLQGVHLGSESTEKQNNRLCRKAFPRCPYPVPVLRKLISFAFTNHGLRTLISKHQDYFVD